MKEIINELSKYRCGKHKKIIAALRGEKELKRGSNPGKRRHKGKVAGK